MTAGTLWLDCTAGASGDMLLGALVGAGVPLQVPLDAVLATALPIRLVESSVQRAGLAATKVDVEIPPDDTARSWRDIRELLTAAALQPTVRERALATFARLAAAEASVHGRPADDVHFHEVGGHDAVADIVGVCACMEHLGVAVVCSPVAVGSGRTGSAHGSLPIPAPAVLELFLAAGLPTCGPPAGATGELCTPTGAALLAEFATGAGGLPPMTVRAIGVGAGSRDPAGHPNVLRAVLGEPIGVPAPTAELLLAANVDDLDPRAWPSVLAALLTAGAVDAWLTPILMKKGRPAFTVSALVPSSSAEAVRAALYRHTTTLGLRESTVVKHALSRDWVTVDVSGQQVRVKLGKAADGAVLNAMPEWRDVEAAAEALGRPVKVVLAAAVAECHTGDISGL